MSSQSCKPVSAASTSMESICEFSIITGPFFGSTCNKHYDTLGSMLGPAVFGNSHIFPYVEISGHSKIAAHEEAIQSVSRGK